LRKQLGLPTAERLTRLHGQRGRHGRHIKHQRWDAQREHRAARPIRIRWIPGWKRRRRRGYGYLYAAGSRRRLLNHPAKTV